MSKPTVFLSHSSVDAKPLRLLKDLLAEKTGGAIALFLSSDGQSIPLGRNWVHEIQTALESCQLMFVFVTPASLHSTWLYFEAGFAYSRKMRVVPVALLGVDLKDVAPPLSLLQGFNATSASGLNNILAVINEELGHSHQETISPGEYERVLSASSARLSLSGTIASTSVQTVRVVLGAKPEASLDSVTSTLEALGVDHEAGRYRVVLFGASIELQTHGPRSFDFEVSIALWPSLVNTIVALLRKIGDPEEIRVYVEFDVRIGMCSGLHNVTARLQGSEIGLEVDEWLRFRQATFKLERNTQYVDRQPVAGSVYLELRCPAAELPNVSLHDLVELLFERNVLLPFEPTDYRG